MCVLNKQSVFCDEGLVDFGNPVGAEQRSGLPELLSQNELDVSSIGRGTPTIPSVSQRFLRALTEVLSHNAVVFSGLIATPLTAAQMRGRR